MKNNTVHIHQFPNGLTLLGEEMDFVSSAAFTLAVSMGVATDPATQQGMANIMTEMFHKGAGPYDSRALSDECEKIGLHVGHSAGIEMSAFSGTLLGENLKRALELYGTVLLEPRFPEDELDSVREQALQELLHLEDNPSSKVMDELVKTLYPQPFGRSQLGSEEGLKAVNIQALRNYYAAEFKPTQAVLAVAGKFNWNEVKDTVERCFGKWQGTKPTLERKGLNPGQIRHIQNESSQVQIALAYPSVELDTPHYYAVRVGVGVLSGGMSGRLFVEVREKRGLVYSVSASHTAAPKRGAIIAYAGTTPERAQETLDVMLKELRALPENLTTEEIERAKADIKSRVIMQSERTGVRANTLANDWWNIQRVRPLEEIKSKLDAVTAQDIRDYCAAFPVKPITLVTLGPKALELKE